MIVFDDVHLTLQAGNLRTTVLNGVSLEMPTDDRLVILGYQSSGKTSLIQLLSGLNAPTSGSIARFGRVSFPVGYMGGYKRKLSVYNNIVHAADLYGADPDEVVNFVAEVAGIGNFLKEKFGNLTPLHRVRFAFALAYAIPFDVYLIDNKIGAGDEEFRLKCERMFEMRAANNGVILTTSLPRYARRFGRKGAILHAGKITLYEDLEKAIWDFEHLERNPLVMRPGVPALDDEAS